MIIGIITLIGSGISALIGAGISITEYGQKLDASLEKALFNIKKAITNDK